MTNKINIQSVKFILPQLSLLSLGLIGGYYYISTTTYETFGIISMIIGFIGSIIHLGNEVRLGIEESKEIET